MTARENRWLVYKQRAERMGIGLEPDAFWLLARIGESGPIDKSQLEKRLNMSGAQFSDLLARLAATGMASEAPNGILALSAKGSADYRRLLQQREDDLKTMLADWQPEQHPDVERMMRDLAKSFASSPPVRPHSP